MGTIFSSAPPRRRSKTPQTSLVGYSKSPGMVLHRKELRTRRVRALTVELELSANSKSEAYSLTSGLFCRSETTLSVSCTVSVSNKGTLAGVASEATVSAAGATNVVKEGAAELCAVAMAAQAKERVNDLVNILNYQDAVFTLKSETDKLNNASGCHVPGVRVGFYTTWVLRLIAACKRWRRIILFYRQMCIPSRWDRV